MSKLFVIAVLVAMGLGTAHADGTALDSLKSGVAVSVIEAAAAPLPEAPVFSAQTTHQRGMGLSTIKAKEDLAVGLIVGKIEDCDGLGVTDGVAAELERAGFKFRFTGNGERSWTFTLDVSGMDAGKAAIILAGYAYFDEILVSKKTYGSLNLDAIKGKADLSAGTIIGKVEDCDGLGVTDGIAAGMERAGFKFKFTNDGERRWTFIVDVAGTDAAKAALALAERHDFDEVLVSEKVYDMLFTAPRQ